MLRLAGLNELRKNLQQPVGKDHPPEFVAQVINVVVGISPVLHQRAAKGHVVPGALHQGQQEVTSPDVAIAIQLAAREPARPW